MPTFPAFQQRLAQINNPHYRGVADTPMQFGIPAGSSMGAAPMRRPRGVNGQIPLIQGDESAGLPPASGTGPTPTGESNPMMSKIKQRVAGDVSYDDIAPKMEEIPGDPQFQAHGKHGFGDRLKVALYGSQAATAQQPGNQFAGIGGFLGGLINPGGAERLAHQEITLPRARKEQMAVMQRNKARQDQVSGEVNNRHRIAQINEMDAPQWSSVPGGETPTLYEKKSGETRQVMGPDGKPMRAASVVNTEERGEYMKEIQRTKDLAKAEVEAANAKARFEQAKAKMDNDRLMKEMAERHKAELEKMKEAGRNRRFGQGEAGKNNRNSANLNERKRANNLRYGDDGAAVPSEGSGGKKLTAPPAK